jgi:hypothetical protein
MATGSSHNKQYSDGKQGSIGTRTGAGGSKMATPRTVSADSIKPAGNTPSGSSQSNKRGKQGW